MYFIRSIILIAAILFISVARTEAKTEFSWWSNSLSKFIPNANEIHDGIKEAFSYWANVTGFTFKEVTDKVGADIKVIYYPGGFSENNHLVSYSYYPNDRSGAEIHILDHYVFQGGIVRNRDIDPVRAFMHQLGYILGQENTTNFETLLTPYFRFSKSQLLGYDQKYTYLTSFHRDPEICNANFDAVSDIDGNLTVIFGNIIYFKATGDFHFLRNLWPELPKNMSKVDAYYADHDGYVTFFIGEMVYMFQDHKLLAGYPKNVNSFLNSSNITQVDLALTYNGVIIVVSGDQYWTGYHCNPQKQHFVGPDSMSNSDILSKSTSIILKRLNGVIYLVMGEQSQRLNRYANNSEPSEQKYKMDLVCLNSFEPPACCNTS